MILYRRKIGYSCLPQITLAIHLFEEQIKRQAKLTDKRNINLFNQDFEEKFQIVKDAYAEIIAYLLYNTEERLVWGKLTDVQKRLYLSSIINQKKSDFDTKNNIISTIAHYTTLPEIENISNHNYRVLKRFIVK